MTGLTSAAPLPARGLRPDRPLAGTARVPGDKSISHRAVMFGGLARGRTEVRDWLDSEDVQATRAAMQALGAEIEALPDGAIAITGFGGAAGARDPEQVLDMGNSGTSARLLMGIIAGLGRMGVMTGDASLRRRPMARVTEPLTRMGAQILTRDGGRLPLALKGRQSLTALDWTQSVASAQVKSAILLAALGAEGVTTVLEPEATRDHTERMLSGFGVAITQEETPQGRRASLMGGQILQAPAAPIVVPGDPSSAAFPMVAALLVPDSDILLTGIGLNPTRTGLLQTLLEMGADITVQDQRTVGGEPVGDLRIRGSRRLKGVHVPASRAPSMIDEYPVLFVAASLAEGESVMPGLSELRVKESDRLGMMAEGLAAAGVDLTPCLDAGAESLTIRGSGRAPQGGITALTRLDHRIAMSFLVLGQVTEQPVAIDDLSPVATSFPSFLPLMRGIGAAIEAG